MDYQDVLAEVGASSAHPGGMKATLHWTKQLHLSQLSEILEVGCGTGRTLTYLCRQFGCKGTGVDLRPAMIEKARQRSAGEQVSVQWQVANATSLPFENDQFDLVITESVNVFIADMPRALSEYLRVLKPGGTYIDVEMALMAPVDEAWKQEVKKVYGAQHVPGMKGWKQTFKEAGFNSVRIVHSQPINPVDMTSADATVPDNMDLSTPGSFQNPHIIKVLQENSNWMEQHYRDMGFAVIAGKK